MWILESVRRINRLTLLYFLASKSVMCIWESSKLTSNEGGKRSNTRWRQVDQGEACKTIFEHVEGDFGSVLLRKSIWSRILSVGRSSSRRGWGRVND